jgi:hypothetical protein
VGSKLFLGPDTHKHTQKKKKQYNHLTRRKMLGLSRFRLSPAVCMGWLKPIVCSIIYRYVLAVADLVGGRSSIGKKSEYWVSIKEPQS